MVKNVVGWLFRLNGHSIDWNQCRQSAIAAFSLENDGGVSKNEYIYVSIYVCFHIHDDIIGAPRQKTIQYKYQQCSLMSLVNASDCCAANFLFTLFLVVQEMSTRKAVPTSAVHT
jgi:hypothetical protein